MHSFTELSKIFEEKFNTRHFPEHTISLYDPAQYILQLGGKRVRPVCVLMGNELFGEIDTDAYYAAAGIELFHNFSLIHDGQGAFAAWHANSTCKIWGQHRFAGWRCNVCKSLRIPKQDESRAFTKSASPV